MSIAPACSSTPSSVGAKRCLLRSYGAREGSTVPSYKHLAPTEPLRFDLYPQFTICYLAVFTFGGGPKSPYAMKPERDESSFWAGRPAHRSLFVSLAVLIT